MSLSIRFMGAALIALAVQAHAQTPTPSDTTAAPRDTVAAAPDTVAAPPSMAAPATTTAAPPTTTTPAPASTPPPASTAPASSSASATSQSAGSRIYYGGTIGFGLWGDYYRISVEPLAAFKFTKRGSGGAKLRYEYLNSRHGQGDSDNYGASVFSRFRVTQRIYGHGELATMSYDYSTGRETVPFLLLGGGVSQMIRPNVWSTAEVLWDVLNDKNSPYEAGQPVVGVGVGF